MLITKKSPFTGKENTMDIPVTQEQIDHWKNSGGTIQRVFPRLTASQREFLMTGMTDADWDTLPGG